MLEVINGGLLTTVQDLGRRGHQQQGIVVGGAMDSFACTMANLLLHNDVDAAVLEMTYTGAQLRFGETTLITLTGGDFTPLIDGVSVPMWRPLLVSKGAVLSFGGARCGARCYLAVGGGIQTPPVLGSRSTYLKAKLGGYFGRPLKGGDLLPLAEQSAWLELFSRQWRPLSRSLQKTGWSVQPEYLAELGDCVTIDITAGPQYELLTTAAQQQLCDSEFIISEKSDRMGYRLTGAAIDTHGLPEMLSNGVSMGTIQLPPDGQPIILLADRQTAGGYPKAAVAAATALPLLAQCMAGQRLKFRLITRRAAEQQYVARENYYHLIKRYIKNLLLGE